MVRRLRNAAAIIGASGALIVGAAGIAQASQGSTLTAGQTRSFSTWFFGRTQVCFQNNSSQTDAYYWVSGPSTGGGVLAAGAGILYDPQLRRPPSEGVGLGPRVAHSYLPHRAVRMASH